MALLVTVMRTQGSLRLILNTKLWAQMQIDKASEKSVRITAMDTEDQGVKVFLISVRPGPPGLLPALGQRAAPTVPQARVVLTGATPEGGPQEPSWAPLCREFLGRTALRGWAGGHEGGL